MGQRGRGEQRSVHEILLTKRIPLNHCAQVILKKEKVLLISELVLLRADLSDLKETGLCG